MNESTRKRGEEDQMGKSIMKLTNQELTAVLQLMQLSGGDSQSESEDSHSSRIEDPVSKDYFDGGGVVVTVPSEALSMTGNEISSASSSDNFYSFNYYPKGNAEGKIIDDAHEEQRWRQRRRRRGLFRKRKFRSIVDIYANIHLSGMKIAKTC